MSTPKRTYELVNKDEITYIYGPFQIDDWSSFEGWEESEFFSASLVGGPTFIVESATLDLCIADLESKLPELRKSHPELMGETK